MKEEHYSKAQMRTFARATRETRQRPLQLAGSKAEAPNSALHRKGAGACYRHLRVGTVGAFWRRSRRERPTAFHDTPAPSQKTHPRHSAICAGGVGHATVVQGFSATPSLD